MRARSGLLVISVLLLGAGCGSGGIGSSAAPSRLAFPQCTRATAKLPVWSSAQSTFVTVPGQPFAVVTTTNGRWAMVSMDGAIGVYSTGSFAPDLTRTIPVAGSMAGEALTPDGRYLVVADGASGAVIVDVARAVGGAPGPVVGRAKAPADGGAVGVAISPDSRFAFVAMEKAGTLAVFDLAKAVAPSAGQESLVGEVPLAAAATGVAVSPDGTSIYATSQAGAGREGLLFLIDLHRAETDPGHAIISQTPAGCSPVRVLPSRDGSTVWVTARGSNEVLAFTAAGLRDDPAHALVATVPVGSAPVALCLIDHDRYLVVSDSNRFGPPNAVGDVRVLDVAAALAGRPSTLAQTPAGGFPRDLAATADGTILLISNYASGQLQAVELHRLPTPR